MDANRICAAVMRYFTEAGYGCLAEFTLTTGQRPDIACLAKDGEIIMIEIKSSVADFRADQKWQDYIPWTDRLYFAVGDEFPIDILPDDSQCGIIVTDGFDCHIHRDAPLHKLAGARRQALIKRLALTAMRRPVMASLALTGDIRQAASEKEDSR